MKTYASTLFVVSVLFAAMGVFMVLYPLVAPRLLDLFGSLLAYFAVALGLMIAGSLGAFRGIHRLQRLN